MENTRMRESNFELMRIFAMFLIILHHFCQFGIFSYWNRNSSMIEHINNFLCYVSSSGGKIGVSLFVLLLGYFSCSQKFRLDKFFYLYLKTLFFSLSFFLSFLYIDMQISIPNTQASLFPFVHKTYWFVTVYLITYTFSPLLNTILRYCSPTLVRKSLLWMTLLWVILPRSYAINMGYTEIAYFMYLYLLAGAIKLNYISFDKRLFKYGGIGILGYYFIFFLTSILLRGNNINLWMLVPYTELNTPYTLFLSLWIFYLFKNLKITSPKINWISSSMFGVYLLHDYKFAHSYVWHTVFHMERTMDSPYYLLVMLTYCFSIFSICVVLDKISSFIYEPLIHFILDAGKKMFDYLTIFYQKILQKFKILCKGN